MRRLISRTAACALSVTLAFSAAAVPCAAGDTAAAKTGGALTRLSPASRQVLVTPAAPASAKPSAARHSDGQAASPSGSESFFKSTRGKVTLALMGAGVGLTLWSIQHDRKPVKSPIR